MSPLSDENTDPADATGIPQNQPTDQPNLQAPDYPVNIIGKPSAGILGNDVMAPSSTSGVHLKHSANTIEPLKPDVPAGNTNPLIPTENPLLTNTVAVSPAVVSFSPGEPITPAVTAAGATTGLVAGTTAGTVEIATSLPVTGPTPVAVASPDAVKTNPLPGATTQPVVVSPQLSNPVVSTMPESNSAGTPASHKKFLPKHFKLGLIVAAVVVVLGGGSALAYFGYYMNPNTIWSQSMGNMNGGYNKLTSYLNTSSKTQYKGVSENGSFKLQAFGSSYSGSLKSQSEGAAATVSAKVDLGIANLDLEVRSVAAAGNSTPDLYLQLSGIKSLSSYLGSGFGTELGSLDGQWIEINHNLLNDIKNNFVKQQETQTSSPKLTWSEIYSFLQSAGNVDQKYLFSTNSSTAVTKVIKNIGLKTVNGHSTYEFKVGFVPAHAKAYVTAMCGALQQSDLGGYIKAETGDTVGNSSTCTQLESAAASLKSSDTVDIWADTSTRLIYQVQVADPSSPAANFIDIGLNYKGGSSYPFYVSGQEKDGSTTIGYSVVATLDEANNSVNLVIGANGTGSDQIKFSSSFALAPSNANLSVQAPSNAMPITTVLNNLGLGNYVTELQDSSGIQLSSLSKLKAGTSPSDAQLVASLISTSFNLSSAAIKD